MGNQMELLEINLIRKHLSASNSKLEKIIILEETSSTNDYLLQQSLSFDDVPLVCFAEKQTAGRGRLGRSWYSPYAQNIYLSFLWNFNKKANELFGLSMVVALAVVTALKDYGIKIGLTLKWPNDVMWQNRKLAGILVETVSRADYLQAVIGVGLNVSMEQRNIPEINQSWTAIAEIIKAIPERNKIAGLLLNQLFDYVTFFQEKGLEVFLAEWQRYDGYLNKELIFMDNDKKIVGVGRGIDSTGALLLATANGIRKFCSGAILGDK